MRASYIMLLTIIGALLILGSMSLYTVDQRAQAIVLQFGQPVGKLKEPGLHVKIPFIQTVRRFDRRILPVDPPPAQMVISSARETSPLTKQPTPVDGAPAPVAAPTQRDNVTGEPIIVDTFARYRITDPLQFMKTLRTVDSANQRLENIINDATRSVMGRTTLRKLLSPERANLMVEISKRVNDKVATDKLGVTIVDVRIVRADLTPELRDSTVRRMISELKERATETRALGDERALEIRSTAGKERTVLLAEAGRDAQMSRGKGDEEAIRIYAEAYNKDPEFYEFNRSMEAYRKTLADPDTRLILSPDNAFLERFKSPD